MTKGQVKVAKKRSSGGRFRDFGTDSGRSSHCRRRLIMVSGDICCLEGWPVGYPFFALSSSCSSTWATCAGSEQKRLASGEYVGAKDGASAGVMRLVCVEQKVKRERKAKRAKAKKAKASYFDRRLQQRKYSLFRMGLGLLDENEREKKAREDKSGLGLRRVFAFLFLSMDGGPFPNPRFLFRFRAS